MTPIHRQPAHARGGLAAVAIGTAGLLAACGSQAPARHPVKVASRGTPPVAAARQEPGARPAVLTLPDLTGNPLAEAEGKLRAAGLEPTVVTRPAAQTAAGAVIETLPSGLSLVARGSTVRIIASSGAPTVRVPNLIGQPEASAEQRLTHAGLLVVVVEQTASDGAGDVAKQDPGPGKSVVAGSTARITVTVPPQVVSVPKLVGQPEEQAVTAASQLGLVISFASLPVNRVIRAGVVVEQNPRPAARVGRGSALTLTIGRYSPATPR